MYVYLVKLFRDPRRAITLSPWCIGKTVVSKQIELFLNLFSQPWYLFINMLKSFYEGFIDDLQTRVFQFNKTFYMIQFRQVDKL